MFFIPGILISILTFPGIIVHELAHQLFCRWYKVPVFKVVYFQMENPVGYVLHEVPSNRWHGVMIGVGPFIVNTVLGALISFPAALPVFTFNSGGILDYILIYFGVSIAMHAFPSSGDADSIWSQVKEKETPLWVKFLGYPIVGLIYLASIGRYVWLDLLYGVGVAIGFPYLVIWLLK